MTTGTPSPPPNGYDSHPLNTDSGVTTIGSNPENDIVIQGAKIQPFHLMVDTRERITRVIALSPDADIRIDGVRLTSDAGLDVSDLSQVQFGGFSHMDHQVAGGNYRRRIGDIHITQLTRGFRCFKGIGVPVNIGFHEIPDPVPAQGKIGVPFQEG